MMRNFPRKAIVLLLATTLLLTITVSGTVAYLMAGTEPLTNTFTPGKMDTRIEETVEGNVKSVIYFRLHENSNVDAYVRAVLIGNWLDDNGNVIATWVIPDAYYNLDGWQKGTDGFYYCKQRLVAPGGGTPNMLRTPIDPDLIPENQRPEGATRLTVTVMHQSIQADPVEAVTEAWGWTPPSN